MKVSALFVFLRVLRASAVNLCLYFFAFPGPGGEMFLLCPGTAAGILFDDSMPSADHAGL